MTLPIIPSTVNDFPQASPCNNSLNGLTNPGVAMLLEDKNPTTNNRDSSHGGSGVMFQIQNENTYIYQKTWTIYTEKVHFGINNEW